MSQRRYMKRNASEFASSAPPAGATQPHLVPTNGPNSLLPTSVPSPADSRAPLAPNLWPQLSGPNSQVRTLWRHLRQTPNAPPVPTLFELLGPNSPVRALWPRLRQTPMHPWSQSSSPNAWCQLSGPNSHVSSSAGSCHTLGPNSWSELSDPNSGGLLLHPRSQLSGPNSWP